VLAGLGDASLEVKDGDDEKRTAAIAVHLSRETF
jgi:hypothetical protein